MFSKFNSALAHIKNSPGIQKILIAGGVCILAVMSASYWIYTQRYVSTDDSYINANTVQLGSQVTGAVNQLYVVNNQFVRRGALLLTIDPEPFQVIVAQDQAKGAIDEVTLRDAQATAKRILSLVRQKTLSPQAGDDATAKLQTALATIAYDKSNLAQAQLNLQYTHIFAPVSGWVTNLTLRAGSLVEANQPLFALIDNTEFWVDANFKETQFARIVPGQRATIEVDMYPQHVFTGYVASISSSSGTAFSLLPPQNATGNWVKVTQRVPVRVHVDTDARFPLRIGTSATVIIDTHSKTR